MLFLCACDTFGNYCVPFLYKKKLFPVVRFLRDTYKNIDNKLFLLTPHSFCHSNVLVRWSARTATATTTTTNNNFALK